MSKFKVLEYHETILTFLGMRFHRLAENSNEFFISILPYYLLITSLSSVLSTGMFIYLNWPNLEVILRTSSIIFIAMIQVSGMFLSFGFSMKTVKSLHFRLQEIIDKQDPESDVFKMYWGVEEKCRNYTKIMIYWVLVNHTMTFASLLISFYFIFIGNFDTSKWILPLDLVVPFNTESLFGWYMLWAYNLQINIAYSVCLALTVSHFLCGCVYIDGICDHLIILFEFLQNEVKQNQTEENPLTYRARKQRIIETLNEAIEVQVKVFEIFELMSGINNGVIFSLLPLNVLIIASTFYNIEYLSIDFVSLTFLVLSNINSLSWPYLFCYFANRITDRIANTGYAVYDTDWFNYPPELRKYLILIIQRSQNPVYFMGLDVMFCSMETFGKIVKTSSSYYMLFRSFSQR